MTVYVSMQAPTTWPFLTPVVPAHLMPSGNAYRPDAGGQIQANQADVGALAGYGFALPGSKLPSITDTGTLVTIAADSKITGSLDVSEHLHFHESADPGTPNVGGVIFANSGNGKLQYTFHDGTTTDLAPATGGGGPFIEVESGSSPIKISAFPAGTAPDGTELIPVVQGGANAVLTQYQMWANQKVVTIYGLPGASGLYSYGSTSKFLGGKPAGYTVAGYGGNCYVGGAYGNGITGFARGGNLYALAGNCGGMGNGGDASVKAGNSQYGGNTTITGGDSTKPATRGGALTLSGGGGTPTGPVKMPNLPTGSTGLASGELYKDALDGVTLKVKA